MNKLKIYLVHKYTSLKVYIRLFKQDPLYVRAILKNKLKRIFNILFLLPFLPLLLPAVLILRIIKPIITIRLGNLESEGIGHFSQPIEIYLSEIECGVHKNSKVIDLWYLHKDISNKALKDKWSEHLNILPRIIQPIHLINKLIPGGKNNEIPYRRITDNENPWQIIDIHNVLSQTEPKITFSKEEKFECSKILKTIGFSPTKKYVCLHVRDGAYYDDSILAGHRNCSVNDYLDCIDYLNELGYLIIRLGAKVEERLLRKGPMVFDYATSGIRSDLLDLYLISKCQFYVGTGAGIDAVASLFRKLIVQLNITEIGNLAWHSGNTIILPKKYKRHDKVIPFSSVAKNGYGNYSLYNQFEKANISFVDNSSEEVREVLWEAHARLNGKWKPEPFDDDNQRIFRSYFSGHADPNKIKAKIGAKFLRSNTELLVS